MKVGRCMQPNEYMNLCVFQSSRPSIDLGLRSLRLKSYYFIWSLHRMGKKKLWSNGPGYKIKMATMPLNSKNLKIPSSFEQVSCCSWNFICSIRYFSFTKFCLNDDSTMTCIVFILSYRSRSWSHLERSGLHLYALSIVSLTEIMRQIFLQIFF